MTVHPALDDDTCTEIPRQFYSEQDHLKLEIVFIKNKCLPQLPKLTVLQQNPPIFNVLAKLEEKA
jgi:hypothetical protein